MRSLRSEEKQWLFRPAALEKTPSRQDGIPLEQELAGRRQAIMWMRSLWLRVAAAIGENDQEATNAKGTMTVGAVLVHRFYMRRSLKDFEPKLLAPTVLFLASKIEEYPLRLRHIVNACLVKFEPGAPLWDSSDQPDAQPLEYRRWEKELLATEEVALEALCFDMSVEQPWPILRRAVRGIDSLWEESSAAGEARAAESGGKGKSRATEGVITELGWTMLHEGYLAPLPILHPPRVLAFATLVLIFAFVDEEPESAALATAAELASSFGLHIEFDEEAGAKGDDLDGVKDALRQYCEYCDSGIIDKGLTQYIVSEPSAEDRRFHRRFRQLPSTNGVTNGKPRPSANGVSEE